MHAKAKPKARKNNKTASGKGGLGTKALAKGVSGKKALVKASPKRTARKLYVPSESEPYMGKRMREYFRRRLLEWRAELLRESGHTLESLRQESLNEPDVADRATLETDRSIELRTRERYFKLVNKIEAALRRIDDRTYGYCDDTGEPIGLKRLMARPIATLSLEAQERHERIERTHRDD